MNYLQAADESPIGLATLWGIGVDKLEIYHKRSHGFFYLRADVLSRKPGRGSMKSNEWISSDNNTLLMSIEQWRADQENRPLTPNFPWKEAIAISEIKKCWRYTDSSTTFQMIRDHLGNTFEQVTLGCLAKAKGPFREYDNWNSMPKDHKWANLDLTVDHNYMFNGLPKVPVDQKVEPARIAKRVKTTSAYVKRMVLKDQEAQKLLPFNGATYDALQANVKVAESLAKAIEHVDGSNKDDLVKELKRIAGSVSWLLREDRDTWREKNNG